TAFALGTHASLFLIATESLGTALAVIALELMLVDARKGTIKLHPNKLFFAVGIVVALARLTMLYCVGTDLDKNKSEEANLTRGVPLVSLLAAFFTALAIFKG